MLRANVSEDAATLALRALVWTLADPERAQRLLAMTGLAPADLRTRVGDRAVLAATLQFLLSHEADLIACAAGIEVPPQALAGAADRLEAA